MAAGLIILMLAMGVPVTSGSSGIAAAGAVDAPADGCTSGTLSVQRNVVGYEYWDGEYMFSQFEAVNFKPKFPDQLRYSVVTFATSANATAECSWTVPAGVTRGHLLVVGGGGAGGTEHGGAGGGGGVFYGKVPITSTLGAVFDPGAVLQVTVGAGGTPAGVGCAGAACAGGEGVASAVAVGGAVVVSAGGGGGGGGDQQPAPAVAGVSHSAGGGGGGGALTDDGAPLAAGAVGAASTVVNDPYRDHPGGLLGGAGGSGAAGAAFGSTRFSGGGGGAKGRPGAAGTGVGAGGVGISFSRGTVIYGAGGGGFERGLGNCGTPCFNYFAKPSGSPSSGGAGGTSGSGGQGTDGTGGGGGGAAGQGGRGGAGIVMIAFPEPIDVIGATELAADFGVAAASSAYSYLNGNPSRTTTFRVRSVGATAVADSPPPGISMNVGRQIVVAASVTPGTYDLVVLAVNDLGTEGRLAVTLTVSRAVQQAVSFATSPPEDARIGVGSYTPTLTGGDGSGAYLLAIDPTVPPVCTMEDGVISFVAVGTCTVVGSRAGDSDFEPSDSVVQNFAVSARDAQAPVTFASAAPSDAVVGDAGDEPQFSGGSGTGAFVLTSLDGDVCTATLAGSVWRVAHVAAGSCELSVVRDGDDQHLISAPTTRSYTVAPDCGELIGDVHHVANAVQLAAVGSAGAGTGRCGLGASYLQAGDITLLPPVSPATSNHTPIGDGVGFTGVYDGGGHAITGLVIDVTGFSGATGLFDSVRGGGLVKDLTLTGANVRTSSSFNTALLVGVLEDSELRDVHVTGQVSSERDGLGGLVGYALRGSIRRATATVTVTVTGAAPPGSTNGWVGGLIGYAEAMTVEDASAHAVVRNAEASGIYTGGLIGLAKSSTVTRVRATGTVDGRTSVGGLIGGLDGGSLSLASSSAFVTDATAAGLGRSTSDLGGLIGWGESGAVVSDVIATGDVTVSSGTDWVGGLIGYATITVERAIATGRVSGSTAQNVGGLVGAASGGATFTQSYWDTEATGQATSRDGGTAATTAQLTSIGTFASWPIVAGWAAHDAAANRGWGICPTVNGGYPFLLWQFGADPCGAVTSSDDDPGGEPEDGSDEAPSDAGAPTSEPVGPGRTVTCTPAAPRVGDTVDCALTGGEIGELVEWRASYNPTFAGGTFTLDSAGAGRFTFVIPSAALGAPVVLEIMGWGSPVAVTARIAGPVPSSIPAGQGPAMLTASWAFVVAMLLAFALFSSTFRRRPQAKGRCEASR